MVKYLETQVTFSEVPDEISLCINITNCPHRCAYCHSKQLREDIGEELTINKLKELIEQNKGITCVCFLGEGNDLTSLALLAQWVKMNTLLKTCWYTGLHGLRSTSLFDMGLFDFVKTGPYIKDRGPLNSKTTNQRFYKNVDNKWVDITYKFW